MTAACSTRTFFVPPRYIKVGSSISPRNRAWKKAKRPSDADLKLQDFPRRRFGPSRLMTAAEYEALCTCHPLGPLSAKNR